MPEKDTYRRFEIHSSNSDGAIIRCALFVCGGHKDVMCVVGCSSEIVLCRCYRVSEVVICGVVW